MPSLLASSRVFYCSQSFLSETLYHWQILRPLCRNSCCQGKPPLPFVSPRPQGRPWPVTSGSRSCCQREKARGQPVSAGRARAWTHRPGALLSTRCWPLAAGALSPGAALLSRRVTRGSDLSAVWEGFSSSHFVRRALTPCPAPPSASRPTQSVRPSVTINLANFLGPTVPQGPHFGGQQRNKTPCCVPFPFNYTGTSFLGRALGGKPRASLAAPYETKHTCSREFPPRLIRAGKKRAFLLVVKGGLRC